ncbi:MAG TPA: AraC family transcriptional regulator [Pseudomonadales bacterium]
MLAIAYNVVSSDDPSRDVRRWIGPAGKWDVAILNGRGARYEAQSSGGAFSLKWMAKGRARYEIDRRAHAVSRASALLLDDGQPYDMEFDARTETESFCVFFAPRLVADAWASVEAGFGEPDAKRRMRSFPNVPFAPLPRLATLLRDLHANGPDNATHLEARLFDVLDEAIATAQRHRRLTAVVPATKAATRAHLVGVVERARSMLDDAHGIGCALDELAADVALSKFHLVRLFRAVYGVTPSDYAERVRMRAVAERLRVSDAPIGDIAAQFGYVSQSAFAKAFRRHSGVAPVVWRRGVRN